MPALILQISRVGFLILLWLFVLAAIRIIRADLRSAEQAAAANTRRRRRAIPATPVAGALPVTTLVVTAGAMAGTRIRLGDIPILIGRAPDSTLVLDDDYASTRHAQISRQGSGYVLEDLGSTNGTYLDRTRVNSPMPVSPGTPIRIGRSVMELRP